HQQPAYAGLKARVPLPVSEAASRQALSLPMFSELTDGEVARVCAAVKDFFR
ncbi:MAG: DegT/DnrJ/EryC1/StrS family aminotransferase, partial [Elusimicrobia bacterium]|nr:DegT/DnrJ/EryC1/StrS family aminotransferase [Elusimicrobiota bacterium]